MLEKLIDERAALIFRWVEAAELRQSAWAQRLLGVLLGGSLLLVGMVLAANGMQARVAPAAPGLRLAFGVLATIAGLLLALSIIFALRGLFFGTGSNPPTGALAPIHLYSPSQEQLIKEALAELLELEKTEHQLRRIFRLTVILFIAATIPYLVMIVLLLV